MPSKRKIAPTRTYFLIGQTITKKNQFVQEEFLKTKSLDSQEEVFHTNTMVEKGEKDTKKLPIKNILLVCGLVVVLVAIGTAVYFYNQYQKAQVLLKNPTLAAQQQTDSLIAMVGKLMELPKGETPTIATVSDVTKLKDQPFFALAQNGDKVFIYTKARKAILYRPSQNIIIDVAPVNIGNTTSVTPAVTTVTPAAKKAKTTPVVTSEPSTTEKTTPTKTQ
ncbi:MAG: hypothetical protein ACREGI_05840 [Candidatus Levyibacteriota bacterium]